MAAALPYVEPSVLTILILSSFLWLSNISNFLLDRTLSCRLARQMLGPDLKNTIVQSGYLGLILLSTKVTRHIPKDDDYAKAAWVASLRSS